MPQKVSSIAHWPLADDAADLGGTHHGTAENVVFREDATAPGGRAAVFNGVDACITVPDHADLRLGDRPFTITAWIKLDSRVTNAPGEILSQFDPAKRRGFSIRTGCSAPGYSSITDMRGISAGMDNAVDGEWRDHGRPWPSNTLVSTLTVYRGQLYTGIGDAMRTEDTPAVFRYAGGTDWEFCGRLDVDPRTRSIQSMIVHQGNLYAGTGTWDWAKTFKGICGPTHVFRYEGGTKWTDCGQFGEARRVLSLASFDGALYAGDDEGKAWRYERDGEWVFCGRLGHHDRVNAMMVYRGHLYGAPHGAVYRYEGGTEWVLVGGHDKLNKDKTNFFGEGQSHTLNVYESHLWVGLWPQGKALRYEGGEGPGVWSDRGTLGVDPIHRCNEINDLTVYNSKLYAGLLPLGEVWRLDEGADWTMIKRLVNNPAYDPKASRSWARVPSMAGFQGRLFAGTSNCDSVAEENPRADTGSVFSFEAGRNVALDDDLGDGWHHLAFVRDETELRLSIDGRVVSRSAKFDARDFDLTNGLPLQIGLGPQNFFTGSICDVRLYDHTREISANP
jgi:hypothetical protein